MKVLVTGSTGFIGSALTVRMGSGKDRVLERVLRVKGWIQVSE